MALRVVMFALLVLASVSSSAPSRAADEPDELMPGRGLFIEANQYN